MYLLKSQSNQLYTILENRQFQLSDFEMKNDHFISDRYRIEGTGIYYNRDNFSFRCGYHDYNFYVSYSPAQESYHKESLASNWDSMLYYFFEWTDALKLETSQPNKWDELAKSISTANIKVIESTEKFNYQEVIEIENRINLLKKRVATIPLSREQAYLIDQKLDHLIDLAKEANKFDWGSFFIGNIMSIIITLSVTPDNAKLLWDAIKAVFNNYILLS